MNESLLREIEEFLQQNNLDITSDDVNFISRIGWKTKVEFVCLDCGTHFEMTIKQLLRPYPVRKGKVCPRCEGERLFKNKLESTYGKNPYEFLSIFTGYQEPLKVRCKDCGYEFAVSKARTLLMNMNIPEGTHPCKKCAQIRNYQRDIKLFEDTCKEKFGECNYEIFDPENFSGLYSKKLLKVRCKVCGYEYKASALNLLNPLNGKHYCKGCNKISYKRKNEDIL